MERMGDKPLPSLKEALAHDPELRKEIKRMVSDRAIVAERKAKNIEGAIKRSHRNKVWSLEEWKDHMDERGCY